MPAPLSVVIPTLNCEQTLPTCLAALYEGVQTGIIGELIITDGGSADRTAKIADAVGAKIVRGPMGRGGQLKRGVEASSRPWVLVLHADTVLPARWPEAISMHMRTQNAGYFQLSFDDESLAASLVAGWANLRSRAFGLPYGDQGLLLPRSLYSEIGGYPDQDLMEDVAIARALKGRVKPIAASVLTSADKYKTQGWVKRGGRNLLTLLRYTMGADPSQLAQRYRRDG